MVARIQKLLNSDHEQIHQPGAVMILAFNREAAQRLEKLLGGSRVVCGTFHAVARKCTADMSSVIHVSEYLVRFRNRLRSGAFQSWPSFLFVDEFQDVNAIQYEIICLLGAKAQVMVVGDDDQNLYQWRGSDIRYIRDFQTDFKPSVMHLSTNFRSESHIIDMVNFARPLASQQSKPAIRCTRPVSSPSKQVPIVSVRHTRDMLEHLHQAILSRPPDIRLSDIVVLARTHRPLYCVEAFLQQRNILCNLSDQAHDRVLLRTVYAFKGCESKWAFVVGLHGEQWPSRYRSGQVLSPEDHFLAEQRAFFVAVSRGQTHMTLYHSATHPSPFVEAHLRRQKSIPLPVARTSATAAPTTLASPDSDFRFTYLHDLLSRMDDLAYETLSALCEPVVSEIAFLSNSYGTLEAKTKWPFWVEDLGLGHEIQLFFRNVMRKMLNATDLGKTSATRAVYGIGIDGYHVRTSPEFQKKLQTSIRRFSDASINWRDCLADIWHVTLCESAVRGRAALLNMALPQDQFLDLMPWLNRLWRILSVLVAKLGPVSAEPFSKQRVENLVSNPHVLVPDAMVHICTSEDTGQEVLHAMCMLAIERRVAIERRISKPQSLVFVNLVGGCVKTTSFAQLDSPQLVKFLLSTLENKSK